MNTTVFSKTSQDTHLEIFKTRVDQETIYLSNEIIDKFNLLLLKISSSTNILVDNEIPDKIHKLTSVKLNPDVVNYINQVRCRIGLLFQRTYLEQLDLEKQIIEQSIPLYIRQAYQEKNNNDFTEAVMIYLSNLYLSEKQRASRNSCSGNFYIESENNKDISTEILQQLNSWNEKIIEIAKAKDPSSINMIVSHLFNFCIYSSNSSISFDNETTLNNWLWLSDFLVNEFVPASKKRLIF